MKAPLEWFRVRRLQSTLTVLATLSAGILIGSVVAHGVHGQDKAVDSRDAAQLHVPDAKSLSTIFTQIAKQEGPAVVNINTETLPKEQTEARQRGGRRRAPQQQAPDDGGGDDGSDDGCRTSSTGFSAAFRAKVRVTVSSRSSARWVRASSSTGAATSSPTIMSSTKPTASTSS